MKKTLTILLVVIMACTLCIGLVACNPGTEDDPADGAKKIKLGLICLHGETSTYDKNFIDAFKAGCAAKGVELVIKTDIAEGEACYTTACDLADQGCNIIFADSFGHESFMLRAAKEFPDVVFAHATGTTAHTANQSNLYNAFASIYEGRYIAGFAAGLKLREMENNNLLKAENITENNEIKIGYVGAYTYAEVVSGYTSWYLGVKAGYAQVGGEKGIRMSVQFTGSWYDEAGEKSAAELLISQGCALISQHADSMGAPTACEQMGIPNVSYNGSTATQCPNTFIISSRINWQVYCEYLIDCVQNGKAISRDFVGTLEDGSVALTALGANAPAQGTQEFLDEVKQKLQNGEIKVFNCSKFTVGGQHLTEYMADVDTDENYTPDTQVIKTENGITYFAESEFRSAPYFDIRIDGIDLLNQKY